MPPMSTYGTFIAARNSGRTNTIEVIEAIFNSLDTNHQFWSWFNQRRVFDAPIPGNVRAFLANPGLTPPKDGLSLSDGEIDHIDDWPKGQKERIRKRVVARVLNEANRAIQLAWAVHMQQNESTDIVDVPEGPITITTSTPWRNIRISADGEDVSFMTGE